MLVIDDVAQVPKDFGPCVVTIGNFDGVHLGHQAVLKALTENAHQRKAKAVVVTFDPHPAMVHHPENAPVQIMGLQDKLSALESLGVDLVLVMNYTLELAQSSPEDFVSDVFVGGLGACCVVVGQDVRWGKDNAGDLQTMRQLGEQQGFAVVEVGEFGQERRNSSTWVREALEGGDVQTAQDVLGRPHRLTGTVVHGAARGRELGFPTANLAPDAQGLIPDDGVYAGWLVDESGQRWPAAISVGSNPTFEGVQRQVEAHVIDRPEEKIEDFDLYGQNISVEFIERLRGMVAFSGIENLIFQMKQDVVHARKVLNEDAARTGVKPAGA